MPGDPIKIMLFEDDKDDATAVLDALEARVTAETTFQVTWFKAGAKTPSSAESRHDLPYPVRMAVADRPVVIDLDVRGRRQANGHVEWWQHQFDAAILDVVHQASAEKVGHWFAEWLGRAGFAGPVCLVSKQGVRTLRWRLANLKRIPKENPDWVARVVSTVAQSRSTASRPPIVNYRGRPPQRLIQDFGEIAARAETGRRTLAYCGDEGALGASLAEFFNMRLMGGGSAHSVEGLAATLREAKKHNFTVPSVILVDCGPGGCVTDNLLYEIAHTDDGLTNHPIWLVLAEEETIGDRKAFDRMNVAIVDRDAIAIKPSVWAFDAIKQLQLSYDVFRDAFGANMAAIRDEQPWRDDVLTAGSDLLKATLPALAMARTMDRLVSNTPSFVSWVSPEAGSVLNKSFSSIPRGVAKRLHKQNRSSEQQLALFAPHGN
jgi:hypothetical protein